MARLFEKRCTVWIFVENSVASMKAKFWATKRLLFIPSPIIFISSTYIYTKMRALPGMPEYFAG